MSLEDKIFVISASLDKIFASSSNGMYWTEFTTPTRGCGLIVYKSQLVLVGGTETSTSKITNKLWLSGGGSNWQLTLPPMPTPCLLPSVTANEQCLVIANQVTVEVLLTDQWATVESLPEKRLISNLTIHNGKLYVNAGSVIYHCDLNSMIHSCTQMPSSSHNMCLWNKLQVPEKVIMASLNFGRQLIGTSGNRIVALSPYTQSWVRVADASLDKAVLSSTVPAGGDELLVVMNDYSVSRAVLKG